MGDAKSREKRADAWHHRAICAQGEQSGAHRRWPGDHGRSRDETLGAQDSAPVQRQGHRRLRGSTADAISLFERFEGKLQEHSGNLQKAAVELAKEWRKDRALRHLEALLIVADTKSTFLLSGTVT